MLYRWPTPGRKASGRQSRSISVRRDSRENQQHTEKPLETPDSKQGHTRTRQFDSTLFLSFKVQNSGMPPLHTSGCASTTATHSISPSRLWGLAGNGLAGDVRVPVDKRTIRIF